MAADSLPLPLEIEEIDSAWLTAALSLKAPGVEVLSCRVVDVRRGTCTKVRLDMELNGVGQAAGVPRRVILKGGFEPHSRVMYPMHEREVRGYQEVVPVLGLRAPVCWFAGCDPARRQGIVVLEDLVDRGVAFCSPLVPNSFEAVARRLSALAAYHAKTWDVADLDGRFGWIDEILASFVVFCDGNFPPDVWASYIASPRGAAASRQFHDRDWMWLALRRMGRLSAARPHAVLHTDTHLGNLYVDVDGEPGFFDSLPGRAPPMLEVAYHLGCALDTGDRRRWEAALIQHYLGALRAHGVEAPGFDDARFQYAVFLAYGYAIFITNAGAYQSEAVNTAYTARFSAAMVDHDTAGLLERLD
jgi:hypothetical protein